MTLSANLTYAAVPTLTQNVSLPEKFLQLGLGKEHMRPYFEKREDVHQNDTVLPQKWLH
jgi:hypothetical protein